MPSACNLLPGRLLREAGPSKTVESFRGIQIETLGYRRCSRLMRRS